MDTSPIDAMTKTIRRLSLCLLLLIAAPLAASAQDAKLAEGQKVLLLLGQLTERPTGLPTPKSTQAIQLFQKQHNLPVTGKIDDGTLDALRNARDTTIGHSMAMPTAQERARQAEPAAPPPAIPTEHLGSESLGGTAVLPSEGRAGSSLPPSVAKPFTSASPLVEHTAGPTGDAPPAPHEEEKSYWQSDMPIWIWAAMAAGVILVGWGVFRRLTAPLNKRVWFDDPGPATPIDRPDPIVSP